MEHKLHFNKALRKSQSPGIFLGSVDLPQELIGHMFYLEVETECVRHSARHLGRSRRRGGRCVVDSPSLWDTHTARTECSILLPHAGFMVAPRRAHQDPASVCSILIAIGVNISPPQPVLGHRGLEQERAMTLVETATGGI